VDNGQLKGGESVRVTTRQLKQQIEQEMLTVFETRKRGDRRADQKMAGLVEISRRLRKTKKRTTR
jgi:hypothetical protein